MLKNKMVAEMERIRATMAKLRKKWLECQLAGLFAELQLLQQPLHHHKREQAAHWSWRCSEP